MKTIEYLNQLIKNPLFTMIFGALLGVCSTLAIQAFNKISDKNNLLIAVKTELDSNYQSIKEVQDTKQVNNLPSNDPMILALRKGNSKYSSLTDEEVFLDFYKNRAVDDIVSTKIWDDLQSQIAKFPEHYKQFNDLYSSLKRVIRFSQIKSGSVTDANKNEIALVNSYGAIRLNSEEFVSKYEKYIMLEE